MSWPKTWLMCWPSFADTAAKGAYERKKSSVRICFSAFSSRSERCIPGWKRSHLLRMMRQGLCSFWMTWAILRSMAEMPASRSMTRRQMSERRMDLSVRMAEKTSTDVSILDRCLRPAVSMRVCSSFPYS